MEQFYQTRLSRHQKMLTRYLKYVLNDHVVLILVFLLGAFGFYYSSFVKELDSTFVIGKPILSLIWFLALFTGHLATLVKDADKVFLLPKEREMRNYLTAAYRHSLLVPFSFLLMIVGLSMPLLVAISRATITDFVCYTLMLYLLKSSHLFQQFTPYFLVKDNRQKKEWLTWCILSLIAISSSLYLHSIIGVVISLLLLFRQLTLTKKTFFTEQLGWENMIQLEQQRLKSIYQFINLFTDVPGITGKVKRRKLFDGLLARIKSTHQNTYLYLYSRSFIRGAEYSGLFIRLTIVGTLVLIFLNDFTLVLIVSLLIIYLIGFQMIPIYGQFEYMTMTQLYPLDPISKKQAVAHLVRSLLLIAGVIFSLLAFIVLPNKSQSLIVVACIFVEILLFVFCYLPSRLKKIDRF